MILKTLSWGPRHGYAIARWIGDTSNDAELSFHLETRIEALVRGGMSYDDAAARARADYGDMAASRHELVEVDRRVLIRWRLLESMATTVADLRYAARQIRRAPVFAA